MVYIGDYIGQLMAEVTMARMQADLEAVRIAELYASHPLLKKMPIPRFRLPDVEINIPLVIQKMEEPNPDEAPRGTPGKREMRKAFDMVFATTLRENKIRLSAEQLKKMKASLDKEIENESTPIELAVNTNFIADRLSKTTASKLKELGVVKEKEKLDELVLNLRSTSRTQFHKLRKAPSRLRALVETSEIREAGSKDNIATFQLKIREEGYEWTSIDPEDDTKDQLVIE